MLEPVTESHTPETAGAHCKRSADRVSSPSPTSPPDLLLVERARCKDARAFETLMRRYNQRLFRIARSIVPDEDAAENIVQEAYLLAFTDLERCESAGKFGACLARLAFNQALALRRSVRPNVTKRRKEPDALPPPALATDALQAGQLDGPQARQMFEQAIDGLPEVFRTVFILRAVEGISGVETAVYLGINETTVRTRLYRAQRRLRVNMARRVSTGRGGIFELDSSRSDHIVDRVFIRLKGAAPLHEQA
jgi:RNA polymerase sigma-70 factor (ECF subfamily)